MLKSIKKLLILSSVGFIAGGINGLLGAGGGILITYFLSYTLKESQTDKNSIFANALITMLPISIVSFIIYFLRGYVALEVNLAYLIAPAILGGIGGAFLLKKINFKIVKILFTALVIYSGFTMLF